MYREALFPSVIFRKAYDTLLARSSKWADLEYLRILHLAATTMESTVESALQQLLILENLPEYETVKALAEPGDVIPTPDVDIPPPNLGAYDSLLMTQEVRL